MPLSPKSGNNDSPSKFSVGDRARVTSEVDKLAALQKQRGELNPLMLLTLNKIGVVKEIDREGYVKVKIGSFAWFYNPGALDKFKSTFFVGDKVKVLSDEEKVRSLQKGHGGWSQLFITAIGKTGTVLDIDTDGDVKVSINDNSWVFNPEALISLTASFSVGDRVKILEDEEKVRSLQKGHGGWSSSIGKALGRTGTVIEIDKDGDIKVAIGDDSWLFNADALKCIAKGAADTERHSNRQQTALPLEKNMIALHLENNSIAASKFMPTTYEKIETLGRGAFGTVYKCRDAKTSRFFAMKEVNVQNFESAEIAQNEVARLKLLNHPRVTDYYGCERKKDSIVIFMEYLSGGSLREVLNTYGMIEENQTLKYTEQILEGLSYIHSAAIVHSDLKCDNLLIDHNGELKIGDFGIAMQVCLDKLGQSIIGSDQGPLGGTLYWMAPEVINQDRCGRSSDIWSLGCTIIEMLTRHPPYSDLPVTAYLTKRARGDLSFNPNELLPKKTSAQTKKFLASLLQVKPAKRPRTASVAYEEFKKLIYKS